MRHTSVVLATLAAAALAGCHHRPPETEQSTTVTTTSTTTTTSASTGSMSGNTSDTVRMATPMSGRERTGVRGDARGELREIHLAERALERARREMERAGHDFGGRKADAMKATDAALHEMRLASGREAREERTGTEERRAEGRELHLALADLERARADMEHASHNFNGRRREALESVDVAIREIRLAAEHEH